MTKLLAILSVVFAFNSFAIADDHAAPAADEAKKEEMKKEEESK
jgi:hypothetical protein